MATDNKKDIEKTAFSTGQGLWLFTIRHLEACTAPETLERLIESVLRGVACKVSMVYLDDIIIGQKFQEQLDKQR